MKSEPTSQAAESLDSSLAAGDSEFSSSLANQAAVNNAAMAEAIARATAELSRVGEAEVAAITSLTDAVVANFEANASQLRSLAALVLELAQAQTRLGTDLARIESNIRSARG